MHVRKKIFRVVPLEPKRRIREVPGVYAIAKSRKDITGRCFEWKKEIIYIGVTNAIWGLKGRLKQFDNAIADKGRHGGGERVLYKYRDYNKLVKQLYVSGAPFRCTVKLPQPTDLRIK